MLRFTRRSLRAARSGSPGPGCGPSYQLVAPDAGSLCLSCSLFLSRSLEGGAVLLKKTMAPETEWWNMWSSLEHSGTWRVEPEDREVQMAQLSRSTSHSVPFICGHSLTQHDTSWCKIFSFQYWCFQCCLYSYIIPHFTPDISIYIAIATEFLAAQDGYTQPGQGTLEQGGHKQTVQLFSWRNSINSK